MRRNIGALIGLLTVAFGISSGAATSSIAPGWRIKSLEAALSDPSRDVQRAAVSWLVGKDVESVEIAIRLDEFLADPGWEEDRPLVLRALSATGSEQMRFSEKVLRLIDNKNPLTRREAIDALGRMETSSPLIISKLEKLLLNSDVEIRRAAVRALANKKGAGDGLAVDFSKLLNDPDNNVRLEVLLALRNQGSNALSYADKVIPLLSHPNSSVRDKAVEAYGRMHANLPVALPAVEALLNDPIDQVRFKAIQAIEAIGIPLPIPTNSILLKLINDRSRSVRRIAVTLVCRDPAIAQALGKELAALATHPDPATRALSLELMENAGATVQDHAQTVIALLKDPDRTVRRSAIATLFAFDPTGASYATNIASSLTDGDPEVRRQAFTILGRMGEGASSLSARVIGLLRDQAYGERDEAVQLLARMHHGKREHASILAEHLRDTNPLVRRYSAWGLGFLGEEGIPYVASIASLLAEADDDSRSGALEGLRMLGPAARPYAAQVASLLTEPGENWRSQAGGNLLLIGEPLDTKSLAATFEAVHAGRRDEQAENRLFGYTITDTNTTNLTLILWLGNRTEAERPQIKSLEEAKEVINTIRSVWPILRDFPDTNKEAAEVLALLARTDGWEIGDLPLLSGIQNDLGEAGFVSQAKDVADVVWWHKFWNKVSRVVLPVGVVQVLFWIFFFIAYPRWRWAQAELFWNPWIRKWWGFGYVGFLLVNWRYARSRLFMPFKDCLVPQSAQTARSDDCYFKERRFRGLGPQEDQILSAEKFEAGIHGRILLEGESGLGKTLFLERLAENSQNVAVLLKATDCAEGVIAAIQHRLHGIVRDDKFLEKLIFAGGMDIFIDGLNEAPWETREKIKQFLKRPFHGSIILSTQRPSSVSVPEDFHQFTLLPLDPDQIRDFMLIQWEDLKSTANFEEPAYRVAVSSYLERIVVPNFAQGQQSSQELLVLSNPMESRLAAELLARGEEPDVYRLVEQRVRLMEEDYRNKHGDSFPRKKLAECAFNSVLKSEGDAKAISLTGLDREAEVLVSHRLVRVGLERESTHWYFRHDRVRDFFILPAFTPPEAKKRRKEYVSDERFWGVYELLAGSPEFDAKDEEEFYRFLNRNAVSGKSVPPELRGRYETARENRVIDELKG